MAWSFKIVRIAGTEIRIHGTFILLLAWLGLMDYQVGGITGMFWGSFFIILLFTCVLLHELGHATAAKRYGIRTPDITLLPIGGIARLEKLPDDPGQEIVVALAGPAVNVAIAFLLFLGMGMALPSNADLVSLESGKGNILAKLFAANVMLVLFNLIPAFPMDGGRVLRAALTFRMDRPQATIIASRIGQGAAILFGAFGLYKGNVILAVIGIFIFFAAGQEMQFSIFKEVAKKLSASQVMGMRFLALPFDLSVQSAIEEISREPMSDYPLVDNQLHIRGMVRRREILRAYRTSPEQTLLDIGFQTPTIRSDSPCWEAVELMQRYQVTLLPVLNPEGQIVGVVSMNQVAEAVAILASDLKKSQ